MSAGRAARGDGAPGPGPAGFPDPAGRARRDAVPWACPPAVIGAPVAEPSRESAVAVRATRRRVAQFALSRLRASLVLRVCAMLSFLEYGALAMLAVLGAKLRPDVWKEGTNFSLAGWMALCSLGSWFFLFAWFPFLESLHAKERGDGSATAMGRVLESFAIGCVDAVHGMLAVILMKAL